MGGDRIFWGRWLERLGYTDGRGLDVIRAAQPTIVVGDHSDLVGQVVAPGGIAGGQQAAVAGQYGLLKVTPRGRPVRITLALSSDIWRVAILDAPGTTFNTGPTALAVQTWQDPVDAVVEMGATTTAPSAVQFRLNMGLGPGLVTQQRDIYIPPNKCLEVQKVTINQNGNFGVILTELVALG